MTSNSAIFSSSVFGTNSGVTAFEIADKLTATEETYFNQFSSARLKNKRPTMPSLQKTIRGQ